jgi:tetratricopeptide (TPR) repeat protein
MAMQLGNIGSVFHEQGDYVKALEYYFKSLTVIEKLGNKSLEATTIGNIGSVYHNQGDYAKALNYYFKSLKISKELGDKQSISVWLGNIGSSYIELANKTSPDSAAYRAELFTKALNYYLNALKIAEEIGNKQYISSWLGNLGNLYEYQIEYPKALKHYLGALKLTNEVGDKNSMVHQLSNIGSLYSKQKKYKEAKEYFKQSLAVATKIGLNDWCQYNCQKLSAIDSALGNYKSAFANYKMHIVYKDSVQNEENTKRQTRTEMQYEFDKKQASDSIRNAEQAEREKLRHDQELKQQRTYTYGGIIGFLLMMVVAGVSYRAYRQKQKANKIIAEQKRKVEEKQKEILDSIHYAKRIQQSLLPAEKYIEKKLNELNKK